MPPKKGSGKSKGKQPAQKAAPKRPAEPNPGDGESDEVEEQRLILCQIEEMEKAQGLSPGGGEGSSTCSWVWCEPFTPHCVEKISSTIVQLYVTFGQVSRSWK